MTASHKQRVCVFLLAVFVGLFSAYFYTIQIGNREFKRYVNLPEYYGLEEKWGLNVLFKLRGPRKTPSDVAVVGIDRFSAEQLNQANGTLLWDRSYHAQLIDRLASVGASVIAFDIYFSRERDSKTDLQLESAMADYKRVVLYRHLQRRSRDMDIARDPLSRFARVASGLGVFPLPKIPERVSQYWTFYPVARTSLVNPDSAGIPLTESPGRMELPTLPVSTLYTLARSQTGFARFSAIVSSCDQTFGSALADQIGELADEAVNSTLELLRPHFRDRYGFQQCVVSSWQRFTQETGMSSSPMNALISVLAAPSKRYMNFIGPPGSIPTVSFSTVLSAEKEELAFLSGKTVFVGLSDTQAVDQKDGRATVFTNAEGLYLSGVEIAATAFDNLLNDEQIIPADERAMFWLIALIGCLATLTFLMLTIGQSVIAYCVFAGSYLTAAVYLLRNDYLWVPVVSPVFILVPAILVLCSIIKNVYSRYQISQYEASIETLMPKMALTHWHSEHVMSTQAKRVFCCCLITDIAGYSTIAERLSPENLAILSNSYFETMGLCVQQNGGEVLFIDGDSMTIVWIADSPSRLMRQQALDCALALCDQVDTFNLTHVSTPFPTRLGVSCGWLAGGNIRSGKQYMYRLHGDTINTAARLEALNKHLGTRLLATQPVTDGLEEFLCNPVGAFVLKGKEEVVDIDEVLGRVSTIEPELIELVHRFQFGRELAKNHEISEAIDVFSTIDKSTGGHILSQFYIHAMNNCDTPASHRIDEHSVIHMNTK